MPVTMLKHRSLNNNNGSILMIMMMGVVVMMVVAGMMFYVKNSTDALTYILTKGSTRAMTEEVIGNILEVYSQPLEGTTCDSGLVAAAVAFRDFSNPAPATYTWETNPTNSSTPPTVSAKNCIVNSQLAAQLERVTLVITPMPASDDLVDARRELRLEIRLQKKNAVVAQSVIRHYTLSLLSLDRYGVIFNSSLATAFDISSDSQLHVDSFVLHSNKSTPFSITQVAGYSVLPSVIFKQMFFTLADRVNAQAGMSLAKFNTVFEKGLIDRHLPNVVNFPTTYSAYTWTEPIDYQFVYPNVGGIQDLSPLPRLAGPKISSNGDGNRYDAGKANIVSFPNSSVMSALTDTCEVGVTASAISKILVLYRGDADVTLDFAGETGVLRFCGLLKVKKLHVKLQSGKTHYLFGKFYFQDIKVTGGGTLYIVDPELDTQLSQNYDAYVSMTDLRRELKSIEVYIANAFYMPINKDITALHDNYKYRLPSLWFSGQPQRNLAGAEIAPAAGPCDTAVPNDWCWPNYMRSYRRHIEDGNLPNISILFKAGSPYNRTLVFNVARTL